MADQEEPSRVLFIHRVVVPPSPFLGSEVVPSFTFSNKWVGFRLVSLDTDP